MHMVSPLNNDLILNGGNNAELEILWKRLDPERWPIPLEDLPHGSALVGGAVRDGLLNRLKKYPDLDFVVPNNALELAKHLAEKLKGRYIVLDANREIARIVINKWTIDFATCKEVNLEEDLRQRDYTINSIALTLSPKKTLIDPTNGMDDIKRKRLIASKEKNLTDDPLRLLRGLRLIAEIDLELDEKTKSWIFKHHKLLEQSAPERIQSEIQKLVKGKLADESIPLLISSGLLSIWQNTNKDLNQILPSFRNTTALSNDERDIAFPLARITYLLSDNGLRKLRFSKKEQKRCSQLRQWKLENDGIEFKTLTETKRLALHQDLEEDLPALIIELAPLQQVQWLERWRDINDPLFHPSTPLDGNTLSEKLNIPPGRIMGEIMRHLLHERAFGRVSTGNEALQAARCWLKQNKPRCD